ncbi:acetyl-CoA synthetase-like protein, partial [Athelia psychrophila]
LLDIPEAGYSASGSPPQGEVCIRGPSVTKEYYKRDDLNHDETIFTKDGWLRTGDVGQWNPDGTMSLMDRIKNLVELASGDYIALERLESIYRSCSLVANICVYASTDANKPIAIIIPHEQNLRTMLPTSVDPSQGLSSLCREKKIQELVLKECNVTGKNNGFQPMETLQAVVLTPDEWTPESGLVNAAQKIQRKKISNLFAEEIEASYLEASLLGSSRSLIFPSSVSFPLTLTITSKVTPNAYFGVGSAGVNSKGEKCRRLAIAKDKLVTQPQEGLETTTDLVDYAARTHGTKDAFGWRDIVDIHHREKDVKKMVGGKEVTEKKQWQFFELSDYKYISFLEIQTRVSELARGLVHYGITSDNVFNIASWPLMSHACASVSTTIATAYDTLGEAGLTRSLNEPECVGIFTNADLLPTVSRVLKNTPSVRFVVYDGEAKASVLTDISAVRESITIIHMDELRATGREKDVETLAGRRPTGDTRLCIMYTSGSTGAPKGVVLTHSNIVAAVGGVQTLLGKHLNPDDSFLAYLPLAHIHEYVVELTLFFLGMTTGFGRVKTLTDASVRKCKGDLAAFRPSVMVGVPAMWETIREGILSKIREGSVVAQSMFRSAYAAKQANVPGLAQLADSAVLSKVKAATGGRLKLALSGGVALSHETQEFLSVALVTMLPGVCDITVQKPHT